MTGVIVAKPGRRRVPERSGHAQMQPPAPGHDGRIGRAVAARCCGARRRHRPALRARSSAGRRPRAQHPRSWADRDRALGGRAGPGARSPRDARAQCHALLHGAPPVARRRAADALWPVLDAQRWRPRAHQQCRASPHRAGRAGRAGGAARAAAAAAQLPAFARAILRPAAAPRRGDFRMRGRVHPGHLRAARARHIRGISRPDRAQPARPAGHGLLAGAGRGRSTDRR